MKLVTIEEPRPLPPITLPPGTYLMEDCHAGVMLQIPGAQVRDAPPTTFDPSRDDALTIVRPGGFGDLLFLTPLLRRLRAEGYRAEVAAAAHYAPILQDVVHVVRYPISMPPYAADASEIHGILCLENLIEYSEAGRTYAAPEVYMRAAFGDGHAPDGWHLEYRPTDAELAWARQALADAPRPLVGIQLSASAQIRSYPPPRVLDLIRAIDGQGRGVLVLGSPRQFIDRPELARTINPTRWAQPPGIRQSIALAHMCDAIIAPDSVMAHIAAAVGIPLVALYGPFPAALRLPESPAIRVLEGRAPCAPCFHAARVIPYVEGQPCNDTGRCAAMEDIAEADILGALDDLLHL